jgi:xanthine dehydrogenase iron-sulfur cluster and FAD-binding subunit A
VTREHDPCAMCAKFTRQGHAEQAAQGLGYCTGYERYVRADAHPTVLFKPAPADQIAERRAFLEQQHNNKETEK